MSETMRSATSAHSHAFLGKAHESSERRTWAVIWICGAMMVGEIIGGLLFGSIALVAHGLHMSTHAGALLLTALAYTYSRKHADDPRFSFGTGKLGDLAGFTSAIVLAMISLLIGYEAVTRLMHPVTIHFGQAIPIAVLGLGVNLASVWLLGSGGHHHGHAHSHGHDADEHGHGDEEHLIATEGGGVVLSVFEDGVPVSACAVRAWRCSPRQCRWRLCGQTARASISPLRIEGTSWSQSTRFRSRMRSRRSSPFQGRTTWLSSPNTNMAPTTVTTTCAPP